MLKPMQISPEDLALLEKDLPGTDPHVQPRPDPGPGGRAILPVADTRIGEREKAYVTSCLESGWISSAGAFIERFERAFAEAMGAEHGVACANGTVALHLALASLGLGPGDEVILPAFTMIATINAVAYTGATPVLVDAEPETWNLDPALLEAKITPRTRAILVVHIYGHPADMDAILAIAKARGLSVVEDAAEAHGAKYRGRPVGSLGDVATFSFYANKILTTGEGGMVLARDAELAATARRLRDHAFSPERHFWHRYRGFNYRMTNLQAALGLGQTERLPELVGIRRRNARLYLDGLRDIPGLQLPAERPDVFNVYWMFGVVVRPDFPMNRDALRAFLAARGIETRTFFIPMHYQPAWHAAFKGQRYPVSEALGRCGFYLPSGPCLTEDEIVYICGVLRSAAGLPG
jgi:perosamine synthetase